LNMRCLCTCICACVCACVRVCVRVSVAFLQKSCKNCNGVDLNGLTPELWLKRNEEINCSQWHFPGFTHFLPFNENSSSKSSLFRIFRLLPLRIKHFKKIYLLLHFYRVCHGSRLRKWDDYSWAAFWPLLKYASFFEAARVVAN